MDTIKLPKPKFGRAATLESALRKRKTTRTVGAKALSPQTLSNLLWAACGINRGNGPFDRAGITAASASNSQEIELFVAHADGTYLYAPEQHALVPVNAEDLRPFAIGRGQGGAGAQAPIRLLYVAEVDKFRLAGFQEPGLKDPEIQKAYYYSDAGMIAANVYLYAASAGLAAWFHNCDKVELAARLKLRPSQRVLFGQTIGYPERP